jgi:HAE1 family hydrophobic/amphiphilic exporter-1
MKLPAPALACLLTLLLLRGTALAQAPAQAMALAPPAPAVRALTLDQALALALAQNKDIAKAKEYANKVKGRYVEERGAALPQVAISAGFYRDRDESQSAIMGPNAPLQREYRQGAVSLNQALFTWGQVSAAIRAAEVGLLTAEDQLRRYRQAALRDVTAAFHDVLLAKEFFAIATENLAQRERHLDQARRRFAVGLATDYDVLAAEVAVENARPEVIRGENQVSLARDRLGFLLGLAGREVDADGHLGAAIAPYPAYEPVLARALTQRPELQDISHQREMAGELVTVYSAGNKPRLDLKAEYGWTELESGQNRDEGMTGMLGVFMTFPIFDGLRTQGRVTQARSDEASLRIEEAKLKDAIRLEVSQAVNAVQESGEIVKGLSGTVSQAERLLFMAEKGFEYGVKTRLEVDDAQLNLKQAKGSLASSQRDYLVSLTNLEWVSGVLGEARPAR